MLRSKVDPKLDTTVHFTPSAKTPISAWLTPLTVASACAASLFIKTRHSALIRIFATATLINLAGHSLSNYFVRKEILFTTEGIPTAGRAWHRDIQINTATTLIFNSIIVAVAAFRQTANTISTRKIVIVMGLATAGQVMARMLALPIMTPSSESAREKDATLSYHMKKSFKFGIIFQTLATSTICGLMLFGRIRALKA